MKKKMMFLIGFLLCSDVFAKSYSTFCLNGSYGLIDENRNIVIDPIYLEIKISEQEYIACRNGGTVDIYDPDTNKILSFADITIISQYSEYEWLLHKYAVENKFRLLTSIFSEFQTAPCINLRCGGCNATRTPSSVLRTYPNRNR